MQTRRLDIRRVFAYLDNAIRLSAFQREYRRHNLCHARRVFRFIRILFKQRLARIRIDNDRGICCNLRCLLCKRRSRRQKRKKER